MTVLINGQSRELRDGETVAAALRSVPDLPETGVAVAVDGQVVPRRDWQHTRLREGSRLEVVVAVQGG